MSAKVGWFQHADTSVTGEIIPVVFNGRSQEAGVIVNLRSAGGKQGIWHAIRVAFRRVRVGSRRDCRENSWD
jgi:hypothetical protein